MGPYPIAVAVSVPKRLFKKAVDRNLLKRRIREAFRLNKTKFYASLEKTDLRANLVIQYQHKEILDFKTIERGVVRALEKMMTQLLEQA